MSERVSSHRRSQRQPSRWPHLLTQFRSAPSLVSLTHLKQGPKPVLCDASEWPVTGFADSVDCILERGATLAREPEHECANFQRALRVAEIAANNSRGDTRGARPLAVRARGPRRSTVNFSLLRVADDQAVEHPPLAVARRVGRAGRQEQLQDDALRDRVVPVISGQTFSTSTATQSPSSPLAMRSISAAYSSRSISSKPISSGSMPTLSR